MSDEINQHRRRLFGTATMALAAAQLGMMGSANAQSLIAKATSLPNIKPGTNTSFGPLKQINAGVLNMGYARLTERQSFFCTAGPTTFTALSTSPRCWPRPATA
jgi:hypothetical protein